MEQSSVSSSARSMAPCDSILTSCNPFACPLSRRFTNLKSPVFRDYVVLGSMSTIYRFADIRGQDNKFVRECQSGSAQAWDELVRRHRRRIYNQCYRFTRRVCDAQDLTQVVLLRVYCTLGSFREEELSFVAWLNLVTRNLLIDHYRKTRRERMMLTLDVAALRTGHIVTMKENPALRYERY